MVRVFDDEGISGSLNLTNRQALLDLFDFTEKNKSISDIIIYSLDRLARDLLIQEQIFYQLKKYQLNIISLREPDLMAEQPSRIFIRQILGAVSEFEKSLISSRMKAGRIRKARSGKHAGGSIALGYKKKEKKNKDGSLATDLVLNKNNADIIAKIYRLRNEGKSLRSIVKILNQDRDNTARGGNWYPSTVRYILNNKLYKGYLNYDGIRSERKELKIIE